MGGKEGSRQRRRWENDRLLSNPYAQPPLPSDWRVQPTYPRHAVPYFLAPLWDAEYARSSSERKKKMDEAKSPASKEEADAKKVTQELRAKLKKRQLEQEGLIDPDSSEDEEIVFVGRNGAMNDIRRREKQEEHLQKDKLIFESLVDDHGAAFGRYLVHSIAAYCGLQTWSVTTGNPARREAYVGLKLDPKTRRPSLTRTEMPRPLWLVV